jgi:lysozyme family protein
MKKYEWAFTVLAQHEGGFVDHSNDPGGATNYGVSLRWLKQEGIDIDNDGDVDEDDVRAITPSKSKQLYKKYFWEPAKCDEIKSYTIATKIFDCAVNMGQRQAYKIAQRAVNKVKSGSKLEVDGIVGSKTLKAINSLTSRDYVLLDEMRKEQFKFYTKLISKNPDLKSFELGWRRRAMS